MVVVDYNQLSSEELDVAVAQALGDATGVTSTWDGHDCKIPTFSPSRKAGHFEYVKCAIKERYRCWNCMWIRDISRPYCFSIHTGYETLADNIVDVWAKTEERAGCIAFLKAVELGEEQFDSDSDSDSDNQEETQNGK